MFLFWMLFLGFMLMMGIFAAISFLANGPKAFETQPRTNDVQALQAKELAVVHDALRTSVERRYLSRDD